MIIAIWFILQSVQKGVYITLTNHPFQGEFQIQFSVFKVKLPILLDVVQSRQINNQLCDL